MVWYRRKSESICVASSSPSPIMGCDSRSKSSHYEFINISYACISFDISSPLSFNRLGFTDVKDAHYPQNIHTRAHKNEHTRLTTLFLQLCLSFANYLRENFIKSMYVIRLLCSFRRIRISSHTEPFSGFSYLHEGYFRIDGKQTRRFPINASEIYRAFDVEIMFIYHLVFLGSWSGCCERCQLLRGEWFPPTQCSAISLSFVSRCKQRTRIFPDIHTYCCFIK